MADKPTKQVKPVSAAKSAILARPPATDQGPVVAIPHPPVEPAVVASKIVAEVEPVTPPQEPVVPRAAAVPPAIAAMPIKATEAARAVVEEAKAAIERASDFIAQSAPAVPAAPFPNPVKGLFDMATSFDTKAFVPTPEAMTSVFGDIQARAKTQMEKGAQIVGEMSDFAKGNVEALVASSRVAAKGTETLAQEAAEYGKKSFESATAAMKSLASAKSPTEFFKLQSDFARASFDAAVVEGSKLTEAWLKLAGEVAQPLSTRVAVAAEKIKAPLAA